MYPPAWTKERIESHDVTLKPVAPDRFVLIGHRSAPYVDRLGDHWAVWPLLDSAWRDNVDDAVQDALTREHRNKNRSVYTRNS
jgi:hypothetical protein